MLYNDIPQDIRDIQNKIDAIYDSYPDATRLNFMIDPGSMKRGHQIWIGRYNQMIFNLCIKYELDASKVLFALANKTV